jgi:hypothetical protein
MTIAHPAPLTTEKQDHPHACLNGYIYLGYTAVDEETGEEVELKTLGGKHASHTFKDWSKISGDEDDGLFIKEGTKAEELVRAVLGADTDLEDLDTDALEGGRFMARVAVSQNGKRNRVDFGSIGRIPAEDSENEFDEIPY